MTPADLARARAIRTAFEQKEQGSLFDTNPTMEHAWDAHLAAALAQRDLAVAEAVREACAASCERMWDECREGADSVEAGRAHRYRWAKGQAARMLANEVRALDLGPVVEGVK